MKKILSLIMALILAFALVSCGESSGTSESESRSDSGVKDTVTDDKLDEKVTGTLHKVNVKESNRRFISGGKTEYKIVIADSSSEAQRAATFMLKHLKAASGADIGVIAYADSGNAVYTADAKYIYVGKNAAFDLAGLKMPSDDLATSGYCIKTAGNSAFITVNNPYGYQMGAIAFLRETIGYDMYSENRVSYDRSPSNMPDMDIVERPDFDYRHWSNPLGSEALYGMGYSTHSAKISVDGNDMHNSFKWLPPDVYASEHPKWFADDTSQLCYTAHGDPVEYEAMQNEIIEKMKEYARDNPTIDTISVSQEDTTSYCKCDECKKEFDKYGAMSATTIKFLNGLSDKINAYFEEEAAKNGTNPRKLYIIQFAYQWTLDAPVKQNENGEWVAFDESVVCNDNVGIEIAPLDAKFTRDFDHEDNAYFREAIDKWSAVTKNIYFWWYETNFHNYMFPYNCWSNMVNQYRYCVQRSTRSMFNEGQLGQSNGTGFTKLKDYIDSKALFDVNVNTAELIDKFFDGYFMDAAEPMREYFDELQTYLTYLQDEYPHVLTGSIYEAISKTESGSPMFWKRKTMSGYMEYIDRAYAAIGKYKATDISLYNALHDNITIESLFPRYVLCRYYDGTFSPDEVTAMRKAFKSDCVRFGNLYEREHDFMTALYSSWGV